MSRTAAPTSAEFAGFFDNAEKGNLCFPRCVACNRFHWYPMLLCPHCQSPDVRWHPVEGRGALFSWTVVRHPFDPKFARQVPYIVGLVTFADAPGVRLVTNIVEAQAETLMIDLPVEPVFETALLSPKSRPSGSIVSFRPIPVGR